ncbi:MAG: hydrogenase maturation nickel metallochaperone HypA [Jatrophihabitantaceae bacterium]
MHELSLCGSIYQIVDRAAEGRSVTTVHLQIGQLRQIVPDTLRYCWTLVTEQTALAGSELEIDSVPLTINCRDCGANTTVEGYPILLCQACESASVAITTGEEFLLTSLELAKA